MEPKTCETCNDSGYREEACVCISETAEAAPRPDCEECLGVGVTWELCGCQPSDPGECGFCGFAFLGFERECPACGHMSGPALSDDEFDG